MNGGVYRGCIAEGLTGGYLAFTSKYSYCLMTVVFVDWPECKTTRGRRRVCATTVYYSIVLNDLHRRMRVGCCEPMLHIYINCMVTVRLSS